MGQEKSRCQLTLVEIVAKSLGETKMSMVVWGRLVILGVRRNKNVCEFGRNPVRIRLRLNKLAEWRIVMASIFNAASTLQVPAR